MAISVTTIGTAIDNVGSGATLAITVPGGGVPSGALIVVAVGEGKLSTYTTGGSLTDTAGNTYTQIANVVVGAAGQGFSVVFYAKNSSALSAGDSITFIKQTSGDEAVMAALYATGVDTTSPLDATVTATASGTSNAPSVTSGAPSATGELFVASLIAQSNTQTYTQDSGHNWVAPPDTNGFDGTNLGSAVVWVAGGDQVNAGSGTIAYTPSMSFTARWGVIVVGFKATGANPVATAWFKPLSEPAFSKSVASFLQPTSFVSLTPDTLPAGVGSSLAWLRQFELPIFPTKYPAWLQQTELALQQQFIGATLSWWQPWTPPYFPKATKTFLQKTELFSPSPATLPVGISGIAWMKPWEPPYYPKAAKPWLMPTLFYSYQLPPIVIYAPAWYKQFDQPAQVRTNVNAQQFIFHTLRRIPRSSGQGYILTIG